MGWSDLGNYLGKLGDSSAGSGVGAGIGTLIGGAAGGPVGAGIGALVSGISGLFGTSAEGKSKLNATHLQSDLEKSAHMIQEQVMSGQTSPTVAMEHLQTLLAMAQNLFNSGDAATKNGATAAMHTINNIYGNMRSGYERQINSTAAPSGGGLPGSITDPTAQKDWMSKQMRDKLMGSSTALAGTSAEKLFKPAFDPLAYVDKAFGKAKEYMPDYTGTAFDPLKKKLGGLA